MLAIFLQAGGSGNVLFQWMPIILMFGVVYFFFIRPQAKKQKEQARFINEIQKGDEVVTSSGIIGKISKIDEEVISLQVDNKTFIRVTKGAISREMTDALKSK